MTTTEHAPRPHPGGAGYPAAMREQAAAMRHDGMGRASIARELGVGFSTVARWFREGSVPTPQHDGEGRRDFRVAHRRVIEERWAFQQAEQDAHRDAVGSLTARELELIGAALYWAEGTKAKAWRRAHRVSFMNSDPGMIRVFLACLGQMGVERNELRCRVAIHESAAVEDALAYWRGVVGDDVVFQRTTLKRHRPATVRRNTNDDYHGCLTVAVAASASTYRRLAGTWEGVSAAIGDGSDPPSSSG